MSEERVNLEINGIALQARKGAMLIEVADEANIRIPRFCYHRKLTVAANCRMCLVEVEKAPKALPACATPVGEGMKVFTHSPKAIAAQKATMAFLLINHPLDCPICDQGGECELQDVAMGYGEDISRFTESKRVVKDKDIGPLVSTDMTRCIHCTRCVRFGTEIAGIRELGATGRGEFMRIGTYVEKTLRSEMSGNVIDLCPVGALNAKPSRMAARAWELIQHAAVAPHDAIGSNVYLHSLRGKVVRAVPRDNESINECWLSDRDRYSYAGLYSEDRLDKPMIKVEGRWQEASWDDALNALAKALRGFSSNELGCLMAANSTLEEMYLLQRLMRGVGVHNIDHRLRQSDFSDQHVAPLFPWLGQSIEELERLDAVLIVGSNIRKEQPIAAHRLRKAALGGAAIMCVNPRDFEFVFDVAEKIIVDPWAMSEELAGIAMAALRLASAEIPAGISQLLSGVKLTDEQKAIAKCLFESERPSVLLGALSIHHPAFSVLRALAYTIADHTAARFGYLPEAANSAGAWLAGMVPHRQAAGQEDGDAGLHAAAMLKAPLKAYLLFGVEPEYDCDDPASARQTMEAAEFVAVCAPFASETTKEYADLLLPIAAFAETSGTFVNAEGRWQSFLGTVPPPAQARPGWKVLRVLGNLCDIEGFDYLSSEQVRDELKQRFSAELSFDNAVDIEGTLKKPRVPQTGLIRISEVPIYAVDALVRRSVPLQQTADAAISAVYLHPEQVKALNLNGSEAVRVQQNGSQVSMSLVADDTVPMGCAWIPAGVDAATLLGPGTGPVELHKD